MTQYTLSINAGSSSLKFRLYEMPQEVVLLSGQFDQINSEQMTLKASFGDGQKLQKAVGMQDFSYAASALLELISEQQIIKSSNAIAVVGHRVAHGGERFKGSVLVGDAELDQIESLCALAPLHNPNNLLCINIFKQALPNAKQVAVFDTAFHQTLHRDKFLYPLPYKMYEQYGIRKFGFHGISHHYVSDVLADEYPDQHLKVINCHLGNGASICAIHGGQSVDTSMGFTPLAGLMMGTRCGDIDPALPEYMAKVAGLSLDDVGKVMNFESGLLGISQISNDFREVELEAEKGNKHAQVAIDMFINRVISTIGAYAATLNGVDVITFTGGIGENSDFVRRAVCQSLSYLGVELTADKVVTGHVISTPCSSVVVKVINTDEELMIARDAFTSLIMR